MFIVVLNKIEDMSSEILDIFGEEVDAIEHLHRASQEWNGGNYSVLIVGPNRVEIQKKEVGWIYSTKSIKFVYEIKEFKGLFMPETPPYEIEEKFN